MVTSLHRYLSALIIVLFAGLYSCDTRREIFPEGKVKVVINYDWSDLSSTPKGATAIFFSTSDPDSDPIYVLTNNATTTTYLAKGTYNVLCFNESINGHDYIQFRNTGSYETFEAYVEDISINSYYSRTDGTKAGAEPGDFATAKLEGFEVSRESVIENKVFTIDFTPKNHIYNLTFTVNVLNGMENAASSGHVGSISGMAEGIILSTSEVNDLEVIHYLSLSDCAFEEGSLQRGTISGTLSCFGIASTISRSTGSNVATAFVTLRDGSSLDPVDEDVTGEIEADQDNEMSLNLSIDIDELPDVTYSEGSESGFDATLNQWENVVDIEMII